MHSVDSLTLARERRTIEMRRAIKDVVNIKPELGDYNSYQAQLYLHSPDSSE